MKRNNHDISIRIQHNRSEVVVSETRFHLQTSAPTREQALETFWYAFFRDGELLALDEEAGVLPPSQIEQLSHIRAVKAYEHNYQRQP